MKTRAQVAMPADTSVDFEEPAPSETFDFDGQAYATYQEMVDAKRRRNRDVLLKSGLLEAKAAVEDTLSEKKRRSAESRGLKRSKAPRREAAPLPRRKSSRIAGTAAPAIYVESELAGRFEVAGGSPAPADADETRFYNGRVNDGSDLTVSQAVELTGSKWAKEGTAAAAERFMKGALADVIDDLPIMSFKRSGRGSPTSVAKVMEPSGPTSEDLKRRVDALSLNDVETSVAKVTPDRIYSVVCHPSPDRIIACAGDRSGHIGMWNVDWRGSPADEPSAHDGVHLFRPHGAAVSSLAWNSHGTTLVSASYDGSVRAFDAGKQVFEEIFATYDEDVMYKDKLGFGTDLGYNSWVQSLEVDHRFSKGCFFLSTSEGRVMHIDLRSKGRMTFNQVLSERKINTVSLHPEGHVMATAGLSRCLQLWDVRGVSSSKTPHRAPRPLSEYRAGRSINSAFFSPSGRRILTTTQSDTLDIFENAHLAAGAIEPTSVVKHDNQTGRYLATFHARWHPGLSSEREMFVVGSMRRPRTIELFDGRGNLIRGIQGDALTAVASRCCFHHNTNNITVVGGNASGRVTVAT